MGEIEENFDTLLKQKNHKEIIGLLSKMLQELSKEGSTSNVIVDTSGIERVIKTLDNASKLDQIPSAIKAIGDAITKKIESLKDNTPKQWIFDIERNKQGLINKVNAKSK